MANGYGQRAKAKTFCVWLQSKEQMTDPRVVQALDLTLALTWTLTLTMALSVPCKCDKA